MPIDEGTNKSATGRNSVLDDIETNRIIEFGEVISVEDPNYLGRIKVRIKGPRNRGGDDGVLDANLPWCFPMLPKHLSVNPKVKESVYIFTLGKDKQHVDRMYFGPIISQPQQLYFDPFYFSSFAGFSFSSVKPDVSISTIPQLKGVFPNPEDISIQGRYNTDITQKKNEIIIRAGKFVESKPDNNNPYPFQFNSTTQAYIQIKNDVVTAPKTDQQAQQIGSVTNIVANKINLLTHKNGSPRYDLTNQDTLISVDELAKIFETAHQLPYGDILLQYLRLLKDAFFAHVHNGNGNAPTDLTISGNKQALAVFKAKADDLEKAMLSSNIRIN